MPLADRLDSIFVHIGFHKCGSTAIQLGLSSLRDDLVAQGIYYPAGDQALLASYYADSRPDFFHNIAFGRADQDAARREDEAFAEGIWDEIARAPARTLVLSYEGFPNLSEPEVGRMFDDFSRRASKVVGVAYCRHPLSFAPSEISQRARSGFETAVTMEPPPLLAFKNTLPKFLSSFGTDNFIVRDVDRRALRDGNVVADFLALLPVDATLIEDAPQTEPEVTKALSQEAVSIAKALTALRDEDRPMSQFFGGELQHFLSAIRGVPIALTPEEQRYVMEKSQVHLDYLKEVFGLQLMAPDETGAAQQDVPFGPDFIESLAKAVKRLIDAADRK